jgi:hypothetical protein
VSNAKLAIKNWNLEILLTAKEKFTVKHATTKQLVFLDTDSETHKVLTNPTVKPKAFLTKETLENQILQFLPIVQVVERSRLPVLNSVLIVVLFAIKYIIKRINYFI